MHEIIQQLIEARRKAGLSLADLEQRTKIPLRQLQHLEAADFAKIGPAVYVRGFIRRYAQEVGLDPQRLLEEHSDQPPVSVATPSHRHSRKGNCNWAAMLRTVFILAMLVASALLIRTAVVAWLQPGPQDPPDMPPVENGQQLPPTEEDEDQDQGDLDGEEEELAVQVELVYSQGREDHYVVRNAEEIIIAASFSGRVWYGIFAPAGDSYRESGFFGSGEEVVWTATEEIKFRFGAPRYVTMVVNGQEITLPTDSGGFNVLIRLENQD